MNVEIPPHLVESLIEIDKRSKIPSLVEFNMNEFGKASMEISRIEPHLIWPCNAFTLLMWVYIDDFGKSQNIQLFSIFSPTKKSHIQTVFVDENGIVYLKINKNDKVFIFHFLKKFIHLKYFNNKRKHWLLSKIVALKSKSGII